MQVDSDMLEHKNKFNELREKLASHKVIVWEDKNSADDVFVEKLIKPNSEYYKPKPDLGKDDGKKTRVLGDGSCFSDKVQMLGIVEATFGGQEGYLR